MDCQIRWKYCTGEAEQKHHISYFPEITVATCDECHKDVHTKQYPELAHYLQYTPGDAKIFYSQNDRIANFIRRTFFRRGKIR